VHPDLGPELRQLAQTILDRVDPAIRLGLLTLLSGAEGSAKCEQVWCPVCALAALINDEQHPMLTVIAEHSTALLDMVSSVVGEQTGSGAPQPPTDPSGPPDRSGRAEPEPTPSDGPGRYQHIPVIVQE
jgi:hypothetical protein